MILLLGATGYIGRAFAREFQRRRQAFIPLSRQAFDYTRFELLFDYLRRMRPEFLINSAGFSGTPNVDACELARVETFQANTLLPQTIARVCLMTNIPWGCVSSGSIYAGAQVFHHGEIRVEKNLNRPELRKLFTEDPGHFFGFTELDEPNFSFRHLPCNFYSGTKALAEESIQEGKAYVWRQKLPFNEQDEACNFLSKLQRYSRVYDHLSSFSHVDDFVRACLDLWERRAPFGTYNVTNPGAISTRRVIEMIVEILKPSRRFEFWQDDRQFEGCATTTPRSSCILDVSKLLRTGVKMRSVEAALEAALENWQPAQVAQTAEGGFEPV